MRVMMAIDGELIATVIESAYVDDERYILLYEFGDADPRYKVDVGNRYLCDNVVRQLFFEGYYDFSKAYKCEVNT